jgi:hypothetical protein
MTATMSTSTTTATMVMNRFGFIIYQMKEANTEPIEMNLEELFHFALNIEEAAINPGKDSEDNPRNSKEQRTPPVRARTDAQTNPSAQRATQLSSVLARVYAVSIQNQITTTVP